MDGVLLEVCNWKERYCSWSLIATTSHIQTLSYHAIPKSPLYNRPLLVWTQCQSGTFPATCPSSSYVIEILWGSRFLPLPHPRCWYWSSCTHLHSFGQMSADHALKLISAPMFHHQKVFPVDLVSRASCIILWLVYWKITYLQIKRFFRSNYLDLFLPNRGTMYRFMLLGFFSPLNLMMIFL
jgi:hypothetical protein